MPRFWLAPLSGELGDLFAELQASAEDTTPLDAGLLNTRMDELRDLALEEDQEINKKCRVQGDPMIIDSRGQKKHYFGPALLVILDSRGVVTALEFVGVKKDNNYISEVWRYELKTKKWKYRDFRHVPTGRDLRDQMCTGEGDMEGPEFVVGDGSWESEAYPDEEPPERFLKKFKRKHKTFFINCKSGSFMEGPEYGILHAVLKRVDEFATQFIKASIVSPCNWMKRAVEQITVNSGPKAPSYPQVSNIQVAQLVYGLYAGAFAFVGTSMAPTIRDDDSSSDDELVAKKDMAHDRLADPWAPTSASKSSWKTCDTSTSASQLEQHATQDPLYLADPWAPQAATESSPKQDLATSTSQLEEHGTHDPLYLADPWATTKYSAVVNTTVPELIGQEDFGSSWKQCKVLANWDPREDPDLNISEYLCLTEGELLRVQQGLEDGWAKAQSVQTGRIGWFPATYAA